MWGYYVKKPIPIKAWKFEDLNDLPKFIEEGFKKGYLEIDFTCTRIFCKTLEGSIYCDKGNWIIQGVNGEYYPIRDDIFKKTYERVAKND